MALFVVLLITPPIIGAVSRRWIVVALPLIGWPLYYIGRNQRWWGEDGTGDGWQVFAVLVTVVAVLITAAAVQAGQRLASRFARPS